MGLSRTVSETNGDFSWKSQIFPTRVLYAPADGVSFEIGYRRKGSKKLEWWIYQMVEKVLII